MALGLARTAGAGARVGVQLHFGSLQARWIFCQVRSLRQIVTLLDRLYSRAKSPTPTSCETHRGNRHNNIPAACFTMKVLHLNTHASGGSYEYATLLSGALNQQGIASHVLGKTGVSTGK